VVALTGTAALTGVDTPEAVKAGLEKSAKNPAAG